MTEQSLRENYLKPFEICAKGEAKAFMSSFNRLGASWCGGNYNLYTGILRNEWGYQGSIVTDWYQVDVGISVSNGAFAWWIPLLVIINIGIYVGADILIMKLGLPLNKFKKSSEEPKEEKEE